MEPGRLLATQIANSTSTRDAKEQLGHADSRQIFRAQIGLLLDVEAD
ncbi:hypothetical protein [Xylanimonas sp. McL0601]